MYFTLPRRDRVLVEYVGRNVYKKYIYLIAVLKTATVQFTCFFILRKFLPNQPFFDDFNSQHKILVNFRTSKLLKKY